MTAVRKRSWTTSKGEARAAWAVDFIDGAGNRQRKQFGTKREAEAFRIEVEGQVRAGTYHPEAAKITIKEAGTAFIEYCRGRMNREEKMTRSTFEAYKRQTEKHILHAQHGLGAIKVGQLTTKRVGKFREDLRDNGMSVPTTRKQIQTLKVILDYAISQDWIAVNVAEKVQVIGRRDEGSLKITPPSKADFKAVLEAAAPTFQIVIKFAAATGVRSSEMHALRWRHLNLEAGKVTIETRVDRYHQEDTTKSIAGLRTIPLGQPIVLMLRKWRLQSRFSKDEDLLFPNKKGGFSGHSNMSANHFRPAREAAGVPSFTWHGFRHFAISCWIEAGLSPKTIQTFAGHSSLSVTMDRYGHLFPSEDHQVAMNVIAVALFS